MGTVIDMFDDAMSRKMEIEEAFEYKNMGESDYKRIEAALIRFAEDLRNI